MMDNEKLKNDKENQRLATERLLKNPDFSLFMRDLFENAAIFRVSAVTSDAHATFYNEGRRAFGLYVFEKLAKIDHNAALNLLKTEDKNG